MTAPNTNDTGAPVIAAPNAPATPAPAAQGPVATSRAAVRSQIMEQAGIVAVADDANAAENANALAGGPPAPGAQAAVPAAAAAPAKPEDGIELAPEGEVPGVGPLKMRFRSADGTYTATPPIPADQKIELEIGGKRYVKDLSGIARLAADGVAAARHATENQRLTTQVIPHYERNVSALQEELNAQIALNREILSDETQWQARRTEFQQLNSPEERARRAESALEERDRLEAESAQMSQRAEYYQENILPALKSVFSEAATISDEEVFGRISLDTAHLQVNGVVPPERYPEFATYIREKLTPWAKALHAKRSEADTARHESEQRAETERRRQAQFETRDVGNAMRPAAAGAPPAGAGQLTTQAPRNRAEARRQILETATG